MQANKKSGAGRMLLLLLVVSAASTGLLWQLKGKPAGWFDWGKPDPLTQALQLIQDRYVDLIPPDSLKGLSLDRLSSRLDPHSAYLDPVALRKANEDLSDHFAGIGIGFSRIRDTITVSFVYPNSPSQKAGIETGDQLLSIGSRSLVRGDPDLKTDSIRVWVRGPVGSIANLTIRSQGVIRQVAVTRANIYTPGVTSAYLIDDSTGYIKLTKFSAGSYRECVSALDSLIQLGMRALILDLRSNGGGFLQEAVDLADEFLADDRLIVYTEGAHLKKRSYFCKRPGLFEKGDLTILMNEYSASASEVLAGALQDWCRAKVIGQRSFGKGLVQEQYDLSNQGALRLTVARYYTPLGRCIQRPYIHDSLLHSDPSQIVVSPVHRNAAKRFLNNCGDTLFDGGGIRPDIEINLTERQPSSPLINRFLDSPELVVWAKRFYQAHRASIDSVRDLGGWATQKPSEELKQFVLRNALTNAGPIDPVDWERLAFEIYAQIARLRDGEQEFVRIQHLRDPFIKRARDTR